MKTIDTLAFTVDHNKHTREHVIEAMKDELASFTQSFNGWAQAIALDAECIDMHLPVAKATTEKMLKCLSQFVDEYDRGREWVSADTYDMAVCVLKEANEQ